MSSTMQLRETMPQQDFSGQPSNPGNPGYPGYPGQPNIPGYLMQPGNPGYPGQHGNPGYLVQPTAPAGIQYTQVNVGVELPRDHILWSLCCLVYGNPLCLGLAALVFSIKSRDRKVVGDVEGARHYGSTARCLNIAATIIVSISILIFIITFSVTIDQARRYYNKYH